MLCRARFRGLRGLTIPFPGISIHLGGPIVRIETALEDFSDPSVMTINHRVTLFTTFLRLRGSQSSTGAFRSVYDDDDDVLSTYLS